MIDQAKQYDTLTPRLAMQLAAPHTWPASVMPALLSVGMASAAGYEVSIVLALLVLAICVLMQSSVNTFNDYYDFVKGSDSLDDNVEVTDATLVYNDLNPKHVLALAIGFLGLAFVLGLYIVYVRGIVPLIIALIGAAVVVLYSAGKTPVSYLPIGELVSGFVMGGLIPLAGYTVLTGEFSPLPLLYAIPTIIAVGLVMMTNNTCDIEKDIPAGRRTLPVLLGREKARTLYRVLVSIWVLSIIILTAMFFSKGLVICIFMVCAGFGTLKALLTNPLLPESRIAAMSQICVAGVIFGAFYICCMLCQSPVSFVIL